MRGLLLIIISSGVGLIIILSLLVHTTYINRTIDEFEYRRYKFNDSIGKYKINN